MLEYRSAFTFLLFGGSIIFFSLFILYYEKYYSLKAERSICFSDECIETADIFLKSMNLSIDPCSDFYAFSCHNYKKTYPKKESWFDNAQEESFRAIYKIITRNKEPEDDLQSAKNLFKSCNNISQTEVLGLNPLYDVLRSVGLSEFPSENNASFDLTSTVAKMKHYLNIDTFFELERIAENNTDKTLVKMKPTVKFKFGWSNPFQIPEMEKRHDVGFFGIDDALEGWKVMVNVMLIVLKDIGKQDLQNFTQLSVYSIKVLKFVVGLYEIVEDEYQDWDTYETNNGTTNENVPENETMVNWTKLADIINDYNDNEQEVVYVKNDNKMLMISKFLRETDTITIQFYVWWLVVSEYAQFTTLEMYRVITTLYYPDQFQHYSREKLCLSYVASMFRYDITEKLEVNHKEEKEIHEVDRIFTNLKETLKVIIKNLTLLDENTKNFVINKIEVMSVSTRIFDGYRNSSYNSKNGFPLQSKLNNTFLKNIVVLKKFGLDVKREDTISPLVNYITFKDANRSQIYVPPAFLKPPFFQNDITSLQYGAIGTLLANELLHAFHYYLGKHAIRTKHQSQCLVHQYNTFMDHTSRVNGSKTLSENFIDNEALHLSYYTFVKNLKSADPKLLAFENFSHYQMFFMSYATAMCGQSSNLETHSPNRVRILGSFQNFQNFSGAFNCNNETIMNPGRKCRIFH